MRIGDSLGWVGKHFMDYYGPYRKDTKEFGCIYNIHEADKPINERNWLVIKSFNTREQAEQSAHDRGTMEVGLGDGKKYIMEHASCRILIPSWQRE